MKSLLTVIIILTSYVCFGQGIDFKHYSFEQAIKEAQKTDKLIFVDVYTKWCGPCKRMAKMVFTQKEMGDYFNSRFICIKVDAETNEGALVKEKYSISSFPTFLWVDKDKNLTAKIIGGYSLPVFLEKTKAITSPESNFHVAKYIYESNKNLFNKSRYYYLGASKGLISKKEANSFLNKLDKNELISNNYLVMLSLQLSTSIDDAKYMRILSNYHNIKSKFKYQNAFADLFGDITRKILLELIESDRSKYDKIKAKINEIIPDSNLSEEADIHCLKLNGELNEFYQQIFKLKINSPVKFCKIAQEAMNNSGINKETLEQLGNHLKDLDRLWNNWKPEKPKTKKEFDEGKLKLNYEWIIKDALAQWLHKIDKADESLKLAIYVNNKRPTKNRKHRINYNYWTTFNCFK